MNRYLNLGCGRKTKMGDAHAQVEVWVNADIVALPGVNCVMDINQPWPWPNDYFDGAEAIHVLEHAFDKMFPIQELWRVLKHGAVAIIEAPNFQSNPDCWADPTHRNAWHPNTMAFTYPNHDYAYYSKARFITVDYFHSNLYLHWELAAYKRDDPELLARHQDCANWRERWEKGGKA